MPSASAARTLLALLGAACCAAAVAQSAEQLATGKRVADRACAVCHGPQGISVQPDAPHLAAQPAVYAEAQLRAFRSGSRRHEVMNVIAKPLTDAEIAALAAYYASLKISVQD